MRKRENNWRSLPRLLHLLFALSPWGVAVSFGSAAATGLLPLLSLIALRHAVDAGLRVAKGGGPGSAVAWMAAFAGAGLIQEVAGSLISTAGYNLQERLRLRVQERLLLKAQALNLAAFEREDLYNRLQRAERFIDQRMFSTMTLITRVGTSAVRCVALLAYVGSAQSLLPVFLGLGSAVAVAVRVRALRERYLMERRQTEPERRLGYLEGLMTGGEAAAEIRLFGTGAHLLGIWERLHAQLRGERLAVARREAARHGASAVGETVTFVLALVVVVALIAGRRLTLGQYAAFSGAVRQLQQALFGLAWELVIIDRDLRFVCDLFDYLDAPEEARGESGLPEPPLRQGVTLQGVTFAYPGVDRPVLRGVDLHLRPGERVALVGPNGAGKTTLANLLLGLYRPTGGRVLVDGVDLASAPPAAWRRRATAVFQDFQQYHLTLRDNIALGDLARARVPGAVEAAAKLSGADEVARSLTNGYETTLGKVLEEGADLSLGQWQKVAVARAYMRDAEIIVLDEPTASLDARAEVAVYRQFREASKGRTALLISHRLGSARLADRIVVLDGGRITEEGTHDELMRRGGLYARMLGMQAEWYA